MFEYLVMFVKCLLVSLEAKGIVFHEISFVGDSYISIDLNDDGWVIEVSYDADDKSLIRISVGNDIDGYRTLLYTKDTKLDIDTFLAAFMIIGNMDKFISVADKQEPVGELVHLIKEIVEKNPDAVIGKYFFDKKCVECGDVFYSKEISLPEYENLTGNPNVGMTNGHAVLVSRCAFCN